MKIGPHEVLGELGRGGMGSVFRVRTPDGREAALKVLKSVDDGTLARFERERRLLAALGEEQGFVGLLDAGASADGAWLLMPLVGGGTLRQRLTAGPLGPEETVALGVQLALALGAAHERGIVHRDVKPENVLFTREGRPLVADLGLAKHFDRGAPGASQSLALTRDGALKGTAGYMAPEQLEDAANVGPSADVFALGAVLYECLAGRPAFEGASPFEVFARVSSGSVEPIPGVPPWLEGIVLRALARDPRERFAHGGSLAGALRGRREPLRVAAKPARRAPRRIVLALVVGALLVAALVGTRTKAPKPTPPGPHASGAPSRPPAPLASNLAARKLIELALEKERASDWEGVIACATKAIELDPGLAMAWATRGNARSLTGDADGGFADLSKAIELDPGLALAWAARGSVRGRKGDLDGEIADSTRAIELDPTFVAAWSHRGWARGQKDDWKGAIADETKAIELAPTFAQAWHARGWARGHADDNDGQLADETRAIELDPTIAQAWQNRGAARSKKGDVDGAIADETRAVELDPTMALAWALRAEARDHKGDLEGSIADYTRAIKLEPGTAAPWANRGAARARTGDLAGATSDYNRFLELAPDNPQVPTVRRVLEEIKAKLPH